MEEVDEVVYVNCVRLLKCQSNNIHNDDEDNDADGESEFLFVFNVVSTVYNGHSCSLSESSLDQYLKVKQFSLTLEQLLDETPKFVHHITELNYFSPSNTENLADKVMDHVLSFLEIDGSFTRVYLIDVQRWVLFPKQLEFDHKLQESFSPFDTFNHIVTLVRQWKQDPNMDVVKVKIPFEEVEVLDLLSIVRDVERNNYIHIAADMEDECAICLKPLAEKVCRDCEVKCILEFNSPNVVKLHCGHTFHHQCLLKWLPGNSCPSCRVFTITIIAS